MRKGIIAVVICLAVLGISIGFMQWRAQNADERMIETATQEEQTETNEVTAQNQPTAVEYNEIETSADETVTTSSEAPVISKDAVLILGSEDAPVTIKEFSSLSCSHCATFHTQALPDLKKDYADAGLVKFEFHPFPTNKEAMEATKLLQCVDIDERYEFMNLLFEQQLQWALPSVNTRQKLMQYAALLGISNEEATACMDDAALEEEIIKDLQAANMDYGVDSTPTFVINPGNEVLIGNRPYGDFSTKIEALIEKQGE